MSMVYLPETTNFPITFLLDMGIVLGALGVVFLRKLIYSALLLGFVFVCVALWYLILNADFLAAAQVLIYVGAVNVLIVFAIMLVNKPELQRTKEWALGDILSGFLFLGLFSFLSNMIITTPWTSADALSIQKEKVINLLSSNSIDIIGVHILTDLLLPFELLSVVLLVALAGAITIARKESFTLGDKNQTEIHISKRPVD
uniref:NAD(P)H-quinone oxidoreductase subunit 6, chloroplastic n=1 Tax=Closterium baillyanum TaxID=1416941 RepID=A0A191T5R5_9VIRI|nr:subunit 6 of NADH-plastoquinone oxidoreductase [Closterium baillyanum]ANI25746.1 subunit 6 of NADH-plastoquinone oxidoreductase [Closterium baillyanum]